ncbi:hypothetical protein D3C87_1794980 [compost metagenome]
MSLIFLQNRKIFPEFPGFIGIKRVGNAEQLAHSDEVKLAVIFVIDLRLQKENVVGPCNLGKISTGGADDNCEKSVEIGLR